MLGLEVRQLADADAVLPGTGAAKAKRALDEAPVQCLHSLQVPRILEVHHEDQVEVAVAGVPHERGCHAGGAQIRLRLDDALG